MCIIHHNPVAYRKWESRYSCKYFPSYDPQFLATNPKPSSDRPALIPLVPCIDKTIASYEELRQMDEVSDWNQATIRLASDLIPKFLAHVHSFTTVGLEAQATAFSYEVDGVIKYLACCHSATK